MIVYKEDRKAIKALGGIAAMAAHPVAEWEQRGKGKYKSFRPLSWTVPDNPGLDPISEAEALAIRAKRSKAGKKATCTRKENDAAFCEEHNLTPGIGAAARRGEVDITVAQRISEKARHRHEETNYDALLAAGYSREDARALKEEV